MSNFEFWCSWFISILTAIISFVLFFKIKDKFCSRRGTVFGLLMGLVVVVVGVILERILLGEFDLVFLFFWFLVLFFSWLGCYFLKNLDFNN